MREMVERGRFTQSADGGLAERLRRGGAYGECSRERVSYAVVSLLTHDVVGFFAGEQNAEVFLARVRTNAPERADQLRVERVKRAA
jgi:hypothetical protein